MEAQLIKFLSDCACLLPILLFSTLSLKARPPQRISLRHRIDVYIGQEAAHRTILGSGNKDKIGKTGTGTK